MRHLLVAIAMLLAFAAAAAEPSDKDIARLKAELMKKTKIAAVTELSGPPSEFKPDSDPNTLEVVFLEKAERGLKRVSEDGQFMFVSVEDSDDEQRALIDQAFENRTRHVLGKT